MERILVIGGGGHARVVLDAIIAAGLFDVAGVLVSRVPAEEPLPGVPVLGIHADLHRLHAEGVGAVAVGVGSVGDSSIRERLFAEAQREGFLLPAVVHPSAAVSRFAEVADGVYIGPNATVCAAARLGFGCIVNTGAVVDHDCDIEAFAHISPSASLSGGVSVGRGTHIGTGASVAHGITIGAGSIVGVGSAVVGNVPDGVIAFGVPCIVERER
jgi:sugar O-acyltransferase (sialic acid O-acetyltransferase NeuD family)